MNVDGACVKLQAFESTGREARTREGKSPFKPGAFAGVDIVWVVYDMGKRLSFDYAVKWLELMAFSGFTKTVVLVANKWEKSLSERRVVSLEEGAATAKEFSAFYFEASPEIELRKYAIAGLDVSVRYTLLEQTKKESLVNSGLGKFPLLQRVSLPQDVTERLKNVALDEMTNDEKAATAMLMHVRKSSSSSLSSSGSAKKGKQAAGGGRSPFKGGKRNLHSDLVDAVKRRDVQSTIAALSSSSRSSSSSSSSTSSRFKQAQLDALLVCAENASGHVDDVKLAEALLQDPRIAPGATTQALWAIVSNKSSGIRKILLPFVRLLLSKNADPSAPDAKGYTAFHRVCEGALSDVLAELIQHTRGLACASASAQGETPVYMCCREGAAQCLSLRASCGGDDIRRSYDLATSKALLCYSPIHVATLGRHYECLELLLSLVRNVNPINSEGYTPLYVALELNDARARDMLMRAGADPRVGKQHRCLVAASFMQDIFVPSHLEWLSKASQTTFEVNLSRCHLERIPEPVFQWTWLRRADFSGCLIETVPRQLFDLDKLEHLLLHDNRLRVVPFGLTGLTNLVTLRLDGNARIPPDLGPVILNATMHRRGNMAALRLDLSALGLVACCDLLATACEHLQELALNQNDLEYVPPDLGCHIKALWLQENKIVSLAGSRALSGELELLNLSGNALTSLSGGLAKCSALREIWLERNRFAQFPSELSSLSALQRLWLDNNQISSLPTSSLLNSFAVLSSLSLNHNRLGGLPSEISLLTSLKRLWLDGNTLQDLPASMGLMTQLELLSLNGNRFGSFPAPIVSMISLKELWLNDAFLNEIDPSVGNLLKLSKLSLCRNRLRFVPQTIAHLTRLKLLDLQGNLDLTSPPPETVKNGTQAILGFLRDLLAESKPSYRMKLMVVGQEAVGKTTLLSTLLGKRKVTKRSAKPGTNLSTDGIDIDHWKRQIKVPSTGESVTVSFKAWDFAGQEVYYSTHGFFLSNRSIYLVVWSMLRGEDQQRVSYWLQSIQCRAQRAPVLLIGTHAESLAPDYLINYEERVLARFRAAFSNLHIASFTAVSPTTGLNMKLLLERIDAATMAQPFIGEPFPVTYLKLEHAVETERKRVPPVMAWDEFRALGTTCHVLREDELLRAVSLLHDMGSLLCFLPSKKHASVSAEADALLLKNQFVVLDPQWLTKMMAQIITTKKSFVQNAVLEHRNMPLMWKAPDYPENLHPHLLRMLQSFDILFRMDAERDFYRGRSLIPIMLHPHPSAQSLLNPPLETTRRETQMGRIFLFEFFPVGFFARLVVRLMAMCVKHEVWSDAALFTVGDSMAAIVTTQQRIEVRIRCPSSQSSASQLALLKMVVQSLEALCEGWFQIQAETLVPCIHCLARKSETPHLFSLSTCEAAASSALPYVVCPAAGSDHSISLQALCPDLTISSDAPVVHWESLENQVRIGEGTFAYVYKATWNGNVVAVKRLINDGDFREWRKEAAALMCLKHKNVVSLLGVCFKPLALITEFLAQGSLYEVLQDASVSLPWTRRLAFAQDIASGMNFLHNTTPPLLHRDLKSANVLLTSELEAKISDFGTAIVQGPYNIGRSVTNPRWVAPEVLLNEEYGAPSDVYAFAIILWEIATRQVPFNDKQAYNWAHNVEDDVCRGVRPPIPDGLRKDYREAMEACWQQVPSARPSFEQALRMLSSTLDLGDIVMDLRQTLRKQGHEAISLK